MFELSQALTVLRTTPETLRVLFSNMDESWLRSDEGPDSWNAIQVLGHLLHGEVTDWIVRAELILQVGEDRAFDPFDRFAQDRLYADTPVAELLDRFESRRKENLARLVSWNLSADRLDRTGVHPAFGPVTLRQLLATWVVHDLGHVAQIARVMAKRYREDVGPWSEYLPILSPRSVA